MSTTTNEIGENAGKTGQGGTPEAGQTQQQSQPTQQPAGETPKDFEAWLAAQPAEAKTLLDSHTSGLKSALVTEREARKELEKKVKDLAGKAEEGSALKTQLDKLSADLAEERRRGSFNESATKAGVTSPRAAYLTAKDLGLLKDDGSVDFAALKQKEPGLFGRAPVPPGNAASGTTTTPPKLTGKAAMNQMIRQLAGRE